MIKFEEIHRLLSKTPVRFVADAISYRVPLRVKKVIYFSETSCFSICPRCDTIMEREYVQFCDRCGQRLSWYALSRAEVCYPRGREHL